MDLSESRSRPARALPALAIVLAVGFARPVVAPPPKAESAGDAIRFVQVGDAQHVEAFDADPAVQDALAKADAAVLRGILTLGVAGSGQAMLGECSVVSRGVAKAVRFAPRFGLVPGQKYVAVFDTTPLVGRDKGKRRELDVSVAKAESPPPEVVAVYPTADVLPENLLRLYLHFSAPMRRGDVYSHINLLGPDGKPVAHPFLELDEELWDASGKRLSLLLHPGRVKRGLKPREEAGPVLEASKSYTLVITTTLCDADGQPLAKEYRKSFTAGPMETSAIDPAKWSLTPPKRPDGPLVVRTPRPLDHGLMVRVITVADAGGHKVAGRVAVTDKETCWTFTPLKPWAGNRFELVVQPILEDVCGNSVGRPFEVDEQRPPSQSGPEKAARVPFEVAP